MPGTWFGIQTASSALQNFQRAMEVTGNNIANVNTRGYSRQVVDFANREGLGYWSQGQKFIGQGVSIASINSIRDQFLDGRVRDTMAEGGKAGTLAAGLQGILQAMNEPGDGGISNALDGFFNSWSSFASNPNEAANKLQVRISAQTLGTRMRATYHDLSSQLGDAQTQVLGTIDQINTISGKIANLNNEIRASSTGGAMPNDLIDQRSRLLEEMSTLINIKTVANQDGTVSVHSAQSTLVDPVGSYDLPKTFDSTTGQLLDGTRPIDIRSGKLSGYLSILNKVSGAMTNLDSLANTLRTEINNLHRTGTNQNGTNGVNFFADVPVGDPQTGAIDFNVSAEVESDVNNISSGVTGKAGDGGLALSIAQLRTATIAGLGNKSLVDFHRDNISAVGSEHAFYVQAEKTQGLLSSQIDAQRQSISGVSLDEEMQNMLRLQRSYQAAAKMISVADQMTEEIIGLIR